RDRPSHTSSTHSTSPTSSLLGLTTVRPIILSALMAGPDIVAAEVDTSSARATATPASSVNATAVVVTKNFLMLRPFQLIRVTAKTIQRQRGVPQSTAKALSGEDLVSLMVERLSVEQASSGRRGRYRKSRHRLDRLLDRFTSDQPRG